MRIGELLIQEGHLTQEGLEEALDWQVLYGGRLGTNLLELRLVEEADLARALGKQLGCETTWGEIDVPPEMVAVIPKHVADRQEMVPWKLEKRRLKVLCTEIKLAELDQLSYKTGRSCVPVVAPEFRIFNLLRAHFGATRQMRALDFGVVPEEGREALRRQKHKPEKPEPPPAPELIDESAFNEIYNQVLAGRGAAPKLETPGLEAPAAASGPPPPPPSAPPPALEQQQRAQQPPPQRPPPPALGAASQPGAPPRTQPPEPARPAPPVMTPSQGAPGAARPAALPPPRAPLPATPPPAAPAHALSSPSLRPPPTAQPPAPEAEVLESLPEDAILEELPEDAIVEGAAGPSASGEHEPLRPVHWDEPAPPAAPERDESPLAFAEAVRLLEGVTDRDSIAHIVLRASRSKAARALLMTVQGGVALGWDGLGAGLAGAAARGVAVPLAAQSAFQLVVKTRSHFMGPLQKTPSNIRFLASTGKQIPLSSLLFPILYRGRVSHLLYLDNGHRQQAPTDVGEMLILSQRITQSVEALVERKRRGA